MSKIYLLTESDMKRLRLILERDPERTTLSEAEKQVYRESLRGINYHIQGWINDVTKD